MQGHKQGAPCCLALSTDGCMLVSGSMGGRKGRSKDDSEDGNMDSSIIVWDVSHVLGKEKRLATVLEPVHV